MKWKEEKKIERKEKPKLWKRRVGILGKQIPVVVLLLVAVGGLGSAALLAYFGRITTTANITEQAVKLLGNPTHEIPEAAPGGERFCYLHKLQNNASVDIDVGFGTTCTKDSTGENTYPLCAGVITTMYSVPETTTLELCPKVIDETGHWICGGSATATLTFDPVNPTFKGTLKTTGLNTGTYALIYYADFNPRFSTWGGDNPGGVITTFTDVQSNGVGGLTIDVNLGMNLPISPDWNINPIPDYCDWRNGFDDYDHCKGAKLWIVPTSDLTNGIELPVINWNNHANWLFEKDLIVYSDCDLEPENFAVDMKTGTLVTTLITKSRDVTPMLICYDFDTKVAPGNYEITTSII